MRPVSREEFNAFLAANEGRLTKGSYGIGDPPAVFYKLGADAVAMHYVYEGWGRPDEFYLL